jgi:myo-inositol-1(or 4)-monophosphatase
VPKRPPFIFALTIQFYLEFIRDALLAANDAVKETTSKRTAGLSLGRGAFGDTTYEVDRSVETRVLDLVSARLPPTTVISEERGIVSRPSAKLTLLMDPVDGSTNAKREVSVYSTSIAIAEGPLFSDIFAAGVIDHVRRRIVWGRKGAVYEDWKLAHPSSELDLKESVVAFDSKLYMVPRPELVGLATAMSATKYPRVLSTAALETACVASGRLDAFVAPFGDLRSFDCLPSLFLVKEAGGAIDVRASSLDSIPLDGSQRVNYIAAANAKLLRQLRARLGYR